MNILLVYKSFPPVMGGVEFYLGMLADRLTGKGHQVRVVTTWNHFRSETEHHSMLTIERCGHWIEAASTPVSPSFFRSFRRWVGWSDLVHLNMPYPPADLAYWMLGGNRPLVITYHSDIIRQRVLGWLHRPLMKAVLNRSRRIMVSSQVYLESSPVLCHYRDKCRIVPIGIPIETNPVSPELQVRAEEIRRRHAPGPLVLFIGRMRHYKGLDIVIRAVERCPAVRLLVIGDGVMASSWRRMAEIGPARDRICFLGDQDEYTKSACLAASDMLVLPSVNRCESWGLVLLEAMACGLPLITTELGTGTSVINQDQFTGLVVPPDDVNALAAAISRMATQPEQRREWGENARRRCQELYRIDPMIDRIEQVYHETLS